MFKKRIETIMENPIVLLTNYGIHEEYRVRFSATHNNFLLYRTDGTAIATFDNPKAVKVEMRKIAPLTAWGFLNTQATMYQQEKSLQSALDVEITA